MILRNLATLAVAFLLTACAGVKLQSPVVFGPSAQASQPVVSATSTMAHIDCERMLQNGCVEIRALSFRWDPANPALAGLDKPYTSGEERQRRAQFLGPQLWEEYRKGTVSAAAPKSFLIYMWKVNSAPSANLSAYRVNTRTHQVRKVMVEEVTGAKAPVFDTSVTNLGAPQKVFRVRTEGRDAVGASIQIPWAMVTDGTYVLVCPEGPAVYPPGKDMGLWLSPESLKWLKNKPSFRILMPFLSPS